MKKQLMALILAGCLLSGAALAENRVEATGGNCNVRTGPGLDYDTIGVAECGETFEYEEYAEADERGVEWYCINFNGSEGWVSSVFCSIVSGEPGETESVEQSEPANNTAASEMDPAEYAQCNCVKASYADSNIRLDAGNEYTTVGTLKKGQAVSYAGEYASDSRGVEWYKIYTTDGFGWVSSVYTVLCADDSMPDLNAVTDEPETENADEGTLTFSEP